jgi:ribosome-binding protein aMBF1 (putative translation factor)
MLEEGRYRLAQEIADAEKIGRSFVSRLLRLTLLAPDIQEAILEGRQARGMQLEELTKAMPGEWGEQRKDLACP